MGAEYPVTVQSPGIVTLTSYLHSYSIIMVDFIGI